MPTLVVISTYHVLPYGDVLKDGEAFNDRNQRIGRAVIWSHQTGLGAEPDLLHSGP